MTTITQTINTDVVQQISKDQFMADVQKLQAYKEMLYNCSLRIEVQKAHRNTGKNLFMSTTECDKNIRKYTAIYQRLKARALSITLNIAINL